MSQAPIKSPRSPTSPGGGVNPAGGPSFIDKLMKMKTSTKVTTQSPSERTVNANVSDALLQENMKQYQEALARKQKLIEDNLIALGQLQDEIDRLSKDIVLERGRRTAEEEKHLISKRAWGTKEVKYDEILRRAAGELEDERLRGFKLRDRLVWAVGVMKTAAARTSQGQLSEDQLPYVGDNEVVANDFEDLVNAIFRNLDDQTADMRGTIASLRDRIARMEKQYRDSVKEKEELEAIILQLQSSVSTKSSTEIGLDAKFNAQKQLNEQLQRLLKQRDREIADSIDRFEKSDQERVRGQLDYDQLLGQMEAMFSGFSFEEENIDEIVQDWTEDITNAVCRDYSGDADFKGIDPDMNNFDSLVIVLNNKLLNDDKYKKFIQGQKVESLEDATENLCRDVIDQVVDTVIPDSKVKLSHRRTLIIANQLAQVVKDNLQKSENTADVVNFSKDKLDQLSFRLRSQIGNTEAGFVDDQVKQVVTEFESDARCSLTPEEQKRIVDANSRNVANRTVNQGNDGLEPYVRELLTRLFRQQISLVGRSRSAADQRDLMDSIVGTLNGMQDQMGIKSGVGKSGKKKGYNQVLSTLQQIISQIDATQGRAGGRKLASLDFLIKFHKWLENLASTLSVSEGSGDLFDATLTAINNLLQERLTMDHILQNTYTKLRDTLSKEHYQGLTVISSKHQKGEVFYTTWLTDFLSQYDKQESLPEKQATMLWILMKLLRSNTQKLFQGKEDYKTLKKQRENDVDLLRKENQELRLQLQASQQQMNLLQSLKGGISVVRNTTVTDQQ